MSVPVLDGPFAGASLPYREAAPAAILLKGSPLPNFEVARYRFDASRSGYVFRGIEVILNYERPTP